MGLKVLIVPDKFKGTLTARQAADAMAAGWQRARPADELELLPMSDGGDGFGEVMSALLGAGSRTCVTVDAAHQPHSAHWWWAAANRTAIIESAQIVGLALLPRGKFHPFELDTAGLAAAIHEARNAGAQRCVMGIGGSATNDGGFGLARTGGWQFLDRAGEPITQWTSVARLATLVPPKRRKWFREFVVAVDVQNRLLGPEGASRVYGPQKGLRTSDFPQAERCLRRLAAVVKEYAGIDIAREPGAGAAGGLGFGLRSFFGARLESGFELFARYSRLAERLRQAQWVVTGEGAIDDSTLMGKGVGQVARLCRKFRVRCVGLAGRVDLNRSTAAGFSCYGLTPTLTNPDEARRRAAHWLTELAATVAHKLEIA